MVDGNDANDREESALGFPALGAATGVVVCDIACKSDLDLVGGAVAVEFAALEVWVTFGDAVVDGGVDGRHVAG